MQSALGAQAQRVRAAEQESVAKSVLAYEASQRVRAAEQESAAKGAQLSALRTKYRHAIEGLRGVQDTLWRELDQIDLHLQREFALRYTHASRAADSSSALALSLPPGDGNKLPSRYLYGWMDVYVRCICYIYVYICIVCVCVCVCVVRRKEMTEETLLRPFLDSFPLYLTH
jgi:hypothetical protein